jgi:uncharacterized membrane protein YvlD (DUF360 family)
MTTTKKTKSFIIVFSSIFIGSFFVQRIILDKVDWSYVQGLLLSAVVSGLVAAFITPLLKDANNRKKGILFLGLYAIFLVAILLFSKGEGFTTTDLSVGGVWATRENDGENFVLDFFKQDSLRLIFPPDQERVVGYMWKEQKLQIYDEEGSLLFNWTVKLDQNRLTILQGEDELIFYKK